MATRLERSTGRPFVSVFLLIAFATASAHAVDRQAQARAAADAAKAFVAQPNPYGAESPAGRLFEAQRAATARALGQNDDAARGVRSAERAAASTTGALTQPVQVQRRERSEPQSTAFSGADGQASFLMEIALTGAEQGASTGDAIDISRQNANDIIAAVQKNSNDMVLMLLESVRTQVEAQRRRDAEQAAQVAAAREARTTNRKTVRDRLGPGASGGRRPASSSSSALDRVPENVQTETQEILGNLDEAARAFTNRR
jgi:hypothetical protein